MFCESRLAVRSVGRESEVGDLGFHLHAHTIRRDHRRLPRDLGGDPASWYPARRVQGRRCRRRHTDGAQSTDEGERRHHLSRSGQHLGGGLPPQRACRCRDRRRSIDGWDTGRRDHADHRRLRHRVPPVPGRAGRPPDTARRRARHWSSGSAESSTEVDAGASTSSPTAPRMQIRSISCGRATRHVGLPRRRRQRFDRDPDRRPAAAGADAFTIGSAVFDGSFSPHKGTSTSQLRDVLEATRRVG